MFLFLRKCAIALQKKTKKTPTHLEISTFEQFNFKSSSKALLCFTLVSIATESILVSAKVSSCFTPRPQPLLFLQIPAGPRGAGWGPYTPERQHISSNKKA